MKLPQVQEASNYVGLYVVDFGDHSGVGFTAAEVAELLDSEQFADVKVYKIHRAEPDGTMELAGVPAERFGLEAGMLFHTADETAGRDAYTRLLAWAESERPPARCKVHLATIDGEYLTALIYPAEYDDAFARWLLDGGYRTGGAVEAGTGAVRRYYDADPQVLERQQLWPAASLENLQGQALLEATKKAVVR